MKRAVQYIIIYLGYHPAVTNCESITAMCCLLTVQWTC